MCEGISYFPHGETSRKSWHHLSVKKIMKLRFGGACNVMWAGFFGQLRNGKCVNWNIGILIGQFIKKLIRLNLHYEKGTDVVVTHTKKTIFKRTKKIISHL